MDVAVELPVGSSKPSASEAQGQSEPGRPGLISTVAMAISMLSVGAVVVGGSLLLSHFAEGMVQAALPPLGAYTLFMLGLLLRRAENPVAVLARAAVDRIAVRPRLAVLSAVLTSICAAAVMLAVLDLMEAADGVLRVAVYERADLRANRLADIPLRLEFKNRTRSDLVRKTDANGMVAFPVSLKDVVTVTLERDDRVLVVRSNAEVTKPVLDGIVGVNVADEKNSWFRKAEAESLGDRIAYLRLDPQMVRWAAGSPTRLIGDSAAAGRFAPYLPLPPGEIVLARKLYVAGFSPTLHQPRWLAYAVSDAPASRRIGPAPYSPDPDLPLEMQVTMADFDRNIFDRALLTRRVDLGTNEAIGAEYAYHSLITPQTSHMNARLWVPLERYASRQKTAGTQVFLLRGPAFVAPPGTWISLNVFGQGLVPVPSHYFQILVVVEDGSARYECHLVPNVPFPQDLEGGRDPAQFRATLAEIRDATGLPLLEGITLGAASKC